jgi:hypothetical protein
MLNIHYNNYSYNKLFFILNSLGYLCDNKCESCNI